MANGAATRALEKDLREGFIILFGGGERACSGPAVLPGESGNVQDGAAIDAIISVIGHDVRENRLPAGAFPNVVAFHQQRATAFKHRFAVAIDVRAGRFGGAAYHDLVRAVLSAAAAIEGDEKIVEVLMTNDERRFDRSLTRTPSGQRV